MSVKNEEEFKESMGDGTLSLLEELNNEIWSSFSI
jgi:hypothetical protein